MAHRVITGKNVVVTGSNRGLGLQVRQQPTITINPSFPLSKEAAPALVSPAGPDALYPPRPPGLSLPPWQFVKQFLSKGNSVVATARNLEKAAELQRLAQEHAGRLTIASLDVSDPASIEKLPSQVPWDRVDVLINNAGGSPRRSGRHTSRPQHPLTTTRPFPLPSQASRVLFAPLRIPTPTS